MEKETQKYVVYYRVSTQKQGISGLGIDAQKASVKSFLKARGGEIVDACTETESGKNNHRPRFKEAVEAVKENNAILLVAKLDRLSRDVHFITGLRKEGINFTACDMPDANKLTINIMAVMAEQERKLIAERTKAALAAAKRRGKKLGTSNKKIKSALKKKGWKNSLTKRKRRADSFAESLRSKIEFLRIEEKKTQQAIVKHFNEYNVAAARGGKWHITQLQRVMERLDID